jgi:hypothetical protein
MLNTILKSKFKIIQFNENARSIDTGNEYKDSGLEIRE